MSRWKEYYEDCLRIPSEMSDNDGKDINSRYLGIGMGNEVTQHTMEETEQATVKLKNNRSPGPDNIPSECIKIGGKNLMN